MNIDTQTQILKLVQEGLEYKKEIELAKDHTKIFNKCMVFALDAVASHDLFLRDHELCKAKPYKELNEDQQYDCMVMFTAYDGYDYSYEAMECQKALARHVEEDIQEQIKYELEHPNEITVKGVRYVRA